MTGITDYCIGCDQQEHDRADAYFGSGDATFPVDQKEVRYGWCAPCRYDSKTFEHFGHEQGSIELCAQSRAFADMVLVEEVITYEIGLPQTATTLEASLIR